jgi:hypothetical protein
VSLSKNEALLLNTKTVFGQIYYLFYAISSIYRRKTLFVLIKNRHYNSKTNYAPEKKIDYDTKMRFAPEKKNDYNTKTRFAPVKKIDYNTKTRFAPEKNLLGIVFNYLYINQIYEKY